MRKEIWKNVPGFPYCQCSNLGNFKTLDRYVPHPRFKKGQFVSGRIRKKVILDGYEYIGLQRNGRSYLYRVGRLLYKAFYGEIPKGMHIGHKDHNRVNNNIKNLEAISAQENMNQQVAAGRHPTAKGLTEYQIKFIRDKNGFTIKKLSLIFNISTQMVGLIRSGKRHGRFTRGVSVTK